MELKISNSSKLNNRGRTAMSQQQLVNSLLAEKQPTQPSQPVNNTIQPVQKWGRYV